ncbi:hemolysin family protein [Candidatus Nomurabacteria bacterium]|nr:hemolysin family protein [Candidatus Nomurabacteria bacterium]
MTALIVLLSGIFAMSEASIFTISGTKAEALKNEKVSGAESLLKIKNKINKPIITLVVLNNVVSIAGSIFVGFYSAKVFDHKFVGIISAMITIIIILFAEIIPKTIGERYSEKISLTISKPILFLSNIFTPIVWFVELFTKNFSDVRKITSEEELKILSRMGHMEGSIEQDEREIIEKVFTMNDLTAKDIMTPRTVMEALEKDQLLDEIMPKLQNAPFSRYPVYEKNIDNIVGFVRTLNLLQALNVGENKKTVGFFTKKILEVRETVKLDILLTIFQKTKNHIAVAKDEFGGTSGIVTLEDVLEQLVGEIMDETDEVADLREMIK